MLKLLLSHWQAHREPLPFVLTDDPLYCSYLTKSPFPEVYSVNRVNPIFEDDETEAKSQSFQLKRSLSEERRESETRASDDTGYSSSGQLKSLADDVGSLEARHMSSDSDDYSQPEAVVVSADVHRVSYPDDVIVLSPSSSSHTFSANSYSSHSESSQEPFDSLTMSSLTDDKSGTTEVKRPTSEVRDKLQKLLERGNETFLDSLDNNKSPQHSADLEFERTRNNLMKSLTRALNNKMSSKENTFDEQAVTRTDDTNPRQATRDGKTNSRAVHSKDTDLGVTRQDESSSSSSLSNTSKQKKYQSRNSKSSSDKPDSKESAFESSDSQKTRAPHKCKLCENVHRPLAFHQLLPGHWSYDNVYLPQIPNMYCPCVYHHHHNPHSSSVPPSSDDDVFYPLYYHHDLARTRHSWAPYTNSRNPFEAYPKRHRSAEDKEALNSPKEKASGNPRYSPDGSSQETDNSSNLKKSLSERRSLREPKKCKCERCLTSALDGNSVPHFHHHGCACYCLSHRKVKFASDTDVSQHRHLHSNSRMANPFINGTPINAALVMDLPHLNGHALSKAQGAKENGFKTKKPPPLIPRGLKEPVKMDELYRSYPINFSEWEAHYRRTFLQKRRKRALNMLGMAFGILFVVGIAIALTFVFLRIKRPA